MYEEIQVKRKINWKRAFCRLGLIVLIVFIFGFILFHPANNTYAEPEFDRNLRAVLEAAKKYSQDNLPNKEGSYTYVKLSTLINEKLIDKKIDLEKSQCNTEQSYAKITKLNNGEYSVLAYLECKNENGSSVDTIK